MAKFKAIDGSDSLAWRASGSLVVAAIAFVLLRLNDGNHFTNLEVAGIALAVGLVAFFVGPKIWNVFRIFK